MLLGSNIVMPMEDCGQTTTSLRRVCQEAGTSMNTKVSHLYGDVPLIP